MRFIVAIVLFVAAFVSIGTGVAQRTIWAGPDSVTAEVTTAGTAPLTVIPGDVLNAHAGTQSIAVEGDGPIILAVGRTEDVLAWVDDAPYAELTYDLETGEMASDSNFGTETELPTPAGSDLWVQEYSGTGSLTRRINAPDDVSVLIAADGTAPAPGTITITWPLDNSAPWSGPLILGGVIALLLGLIVFVWALVDSRRGPRRGSGRLRRAPRPPRMKRRSGRKGATAGTDVAVPDREGGAEGGDPVDAPAPESDESDQKRARRKGAPRRGSAKKRGFIAATALLGATVLLSACAPARVPTPGPTESPDVESPAIAVTEEQLDRIVGSISATISAADSAQDAEVAETRLAGAALDQRLANYTIRSRDSAAVGEPAVIPDVVLLSLPQQTAEWPRTVFAVVDDEDDPSTAPTALVLVQDEPRTQYHVTYVMAVVKSLPDLAPADIGAPRLAPDNRLGLLSPAELAEAYGDVLINGEESDFAEFFDLEGDPVYEAYGPDYKAERASNIPPSAALEFSNGPGDEPAVSFGTNDAGQIVAVELADVETVRPLEAGAAVNPNGAVKALANTTQSTRGIAATYGIQLLFYVPQAGAEDQRIVLLGYTQALVAASELG